MAYKNKQDLKNHYIANAEHYKWKARLNRHGITKDQFYEILEQQDGKCALCDKTFETIWKNDCHIDHCHETGRTRGILCMKCNVGLGMLGDNEEGLLKAISYIKGELR